MFFFFLQSSPVLKNVWDGLFFDGGFSWENVKCTREDEWTVLRRQLKATAEDQSRHIYIYPGRTGVKFSTQNGDEGFGYGISFFLPAPPHRRKYDMPHTAMPSLRRVSLHLFFRGAHIERIFARYCKAAATDFARSSLYVAFLLTIAFTRAKSKIREHETLNVKFFSLSIEDNLFQIADVVSVALPRYTVQRREAICCPGPPPAAAPSRLLCNQCWWLFHRSPTLNILISIRRYMRIVVSNTHREYGRRLSFDVLAQSLSGDALSFLSIACI